MIPPSRRPVRDRHLPVVLPQKFQLASLNYRQVVSAQLVEKQLRLEVLMCPSTTASLAPSAVVQPFSVGTLKDITGLVEFLASSAIEDDEPVSDFGQLYYSVSVDWSNDAPLSEFSLSTFKKQAVRLDVHPEELVIDAFLVGSLIPLGYPQKPIETMPRVGLSLFGWCCLLC